MNIELRPIEQVTPYEKNPRRNDGAVDAVARSLREFGFRQPIVVDAEGVVVVGHTRLKAAIRLGMTHVPVHVAVGLTPAQARAYRIADNQTATIAEWDEVLLPAELAELKGLDVDLDLLGFSADDLDRWTAPPEQEGLTNADDVPPVPETPFTKPGDMWVLGNHRLLCGDSTEPSDVQRLLDGAVPFLMATDPPYGVEYDPNWRKEAGLAEGGRSGKVSNDHKFDWTPTYRLFPGDVAYVWHAGRYAGEVASHLNAAGFEIRAQIRWRKPRFAISRGHYHWSHEPAWYCCREGRSSKWRGDRKQSTVWDIALKDDSFDSDHGTQKPVECMARPIRHHGGVEDGVYDPFCGSGTTLVAAERLGRRCWAMELEPKYCDVIVTRWEQFTGKKAKRLNGEGR